MEIKKTFRNIIIKAMHASAVANSVNCPLIIAHNCPLADGT